MKHLLALFLAVPLMAQNHDWYQQKSKHLVGGACISILFGAHTKRPVIGLSIGIAAGIGKEIYDHQHGNESGASHRADIAITAAGAFGGYLFLKHRERKRIQDIPSIPIPPKE